MKKQLRLPLALLLTLFMAFCLLCGSAWATETELPEVSAQTMSVMGSGTCGENLTWTLDEEGTLTISGTGNMKNYYKNDPSPWSRFPNNTIKKVEIKSGVTCIGDRAYQDCSSLTSVSVPYITRIGFWFSSTLFRVLLPFLCFLNC